MKGTPGLLWFLKKECNVERIPSLQHLNIEGLQLITQMIEVIKTLVDKIWKNLRSCK
jgi:hypothetical protein